MTPLAGTPLAASPATYNVNNQLTNWKGATLTYDANGNLTSDGTNTYTWNARNQLLSISGPVPASFQYDPFGRRVNKTIVGMTQYLYDGVNPVQELSGTTASANLLTGGVDEYFQRTDLVGARSFLTDALGSTLALADSTGTLQAQYTFEPFGNTSVTGTASTNSFAYTGRELDSTGLYFYRARYYSPTLQRFVSEDPLGFGSGGLNFYLYAGDDPVNHTDPSGLFAPPWHEAITLLAALGNGYSFGDAFTLASGVSWVDFRGCPGLNCSQNPDANHSNTHAMSGRKPNGNPQTCEQAFQGAQQQLIDDIGSGDISKAVHTIEDAYAAGHRGFQFWPGGVPDADHEAGDWNPSIADVAGATAAASAFLADLKSNRQHLRRGEPIDTSKYFPSRPCQRDLI